MTPLEVQGLSMAPWLKPGDVVLIDPARSIDRVRLGDLVVYRHKATKAAIVHRVVQARPLRVKGDRNPDCDVLPEEWKYEGAVAKFYRDGRWRPLTFGRILAWISVRGLYPGQKIPVWLSRTKLRTLIFR